MATAEYQRLWRQKNKGKINQYMKTWRDKHPEAQLANARKWVEANRQKTRDAANAWYAANRDTVNAKKREARKADPAPFREMDKKRVRVYSPEVRKRGFLKHREKVLADCKKYQKEHRAERSAYLRKWCKKNTEKHREHSRKGNKMWRERHPDLAKQKWSIDSHKRRACKIGNGGTHTHEEWIARVIFNEWKCFYCLRELTITSVTKDHYLPLVKGGTDFADNLVPSCSHCNSRKGSKIIERGYFYSNPNQ